MRGFIEGLGLTQGELASRLGVSRRTVNQLVNDRRTVTAAMALRLGRLSNTTPEFWLNLQQAVDLWEARRDCGRVVDRIVPLGEAVRGKPSAPE